VRGLDLILLALVAYATIITVGHALNKYTRLPWMFTTVILGMTLAALGLFQDTFASENFAFLSQMGMFFFLLTIGLDLDLPEIRRLGRYIVGGDILLTLTEGTLLALFFYFLLPDFVNHSFFIALLAGIAFGTVGEVVLLAILKEFKLEGTRFGQLALGIGVFDDVFEILVLATVVALPHILQQSAPGEAWQSSLIIVATLVGLAALTFLAAKLSRFARAQLQRLPADSFAIPFFIFAVVFGFIYLGSSRFDNLGVVAAIFGGVAIKQLLPETLLQQYKKPIFFVANIFLGPFFFLSLGNKMQFSALLAWPLIVVAVILISLFSRLSVSYLLFHRLLGKRQSLIMGVGLTSKFSTSVITENLLFTSGMITAPLYSILMGVFIILKPLIVGVFSRGAALIAAERQAELVAAEQQAIGIDSIKEKAVPIISQEVSQNGI
jgi:Kef-type K+ transport system membrane component KefB